MIEHKVFDQGLATEGRGTAQQGIKGTIGNDWQRDRQTLAAGRGHRLQHQTTTLLEAGHAGGDPVGTGRQGRQGRPLGDSGRTDHHGVLHLGQAGQQLARHRRVAQSPAGHAIGLGERMKGDGVAATAADPPGGLVGHRAMHEGGIGLIADMEKAALSTELVDGRQHVTRNHHPARIGWRHGHDGPGAGRDRGGQPLRIRHEARGHSHGHPGGQLNRHDMVEIPRHGQDHLIAGIEDHLGDGVKGHVASGRHQQGGAVEV